MARNPKTDWVIARDEYIKTKDLSLKGVAQRYGVSYSRVRGVSMKEGWVKLKIEKWGKAAEDALEETEGSIKDLIVRHSKIARFLQAGGLREIQKKLKAMKDNPKLANEASIRDLLALVAEGLKAERELYPKQMQFKGDLAIEGEGLSPELREAIYESFRRKLGRKRPSIHRGIGSKKAKGDKN